MIGLYELAFILILPLIVLSYYIHCKTRQFFITYSDEGTKKGLTGKRIALSMLNAEDLNNIIVEETSGTLSDHYDPKKKVIRLSREVSRSSSISAIGIAAHEAAHAVQHGTDYFPMKLRNQMFPIVDMAGFMILPLFLFAILLAKTGVSILLLDLAILFFMAVMAFYLITLPVEFNASKRALNYLKSNGVVDEEELEKVKKVLKMAALTYVVGALLALVQLIRMLGFRK